MGQAGVFRASDPVLDPSVCAVAGIEVGELPEGGVGGERGVAPPVSLFERIQLRTGVRAFPAHDHPRPRRIADQRTGGQHAGDLGQRRAVAVSAIGVGRVCLQPLWESADRRAFLVLDRPADGELAAHRVLAQVPDVGEELPGAAGGVGSDQDRGAVPVLVGQLCERGVARSPGDCPLRAVWCSRSGIPDQRPWS